MNGSGNIIDVLGVNPITSTEMRKAQSLWAAMYEGHPTWVHEGTDDDPLNIISLGLPAAICSEKARMAVLEMKSEITTPTESVEIQNPNYNPTPDQESNGDIPLSFPEPETITEDQPITDTTRADFLNEQYQSGVLPVLRRQLEYAVAKGGMVITPYLVWKETPDTQNQEQVQEEAQEEQKPGFAFDFTQADSFIPLAFDTTGKIIDGAFLKSRIKHSKILN